MAETPLVFEIATFAVLAVFFVVDLFIIGRKPHVPSTKECVQHIAFFVVMALIFGGLMWFFAGSKPAIEFYSGWLTEYSLSIDNLFVFVIIMSNFAVPKQLQKFVLSIGITIALVLRGVFILIGAAIISRFTWVFFLFGAFLIVTAIKLVTGGDEDEEYHENGLIRALRKVIKITDEYDGEKLRTVKNGAKYWTPMLIVFLTIGTTDVMFAFRFHSCDFRFDEGSVHCVHVQCVRVARFAAAVLPAWRAARQAGVSAAWTCPWCWASLASSSLWRHCTAIRCRSSMAVNRSLGCLKCLHGYRLAVIVVAIGGAALASVLKMRAIEAKEK